MEECPFCDVVGSRIEPYKVYEDDRTLGFLDLKPASRGHSLIVPKFHASSLTELDADQTAALFNAVRKVSKAIDSRLKPQGINVFQSSGDVDGREINHLHVHIIPRYTEDEIDFSLRGTELNEKEGEKLSQILFESIED